MKSAVNISKLVKKPDQRLFFGSRITASPTLLTDTSSPLKRHSFGSRTA